MRNQINPRMRPCTVMGLFHETDECGLLKTVFICLIIKHCYTSIPTRNLNCTF